MKGSLDDVSNPCQVSAEVMLTRWPSLGEKLFSYAPRDRKRIRQRVGVNADRE